jgi:Na+/H+ antiporter
MAPRLRGPGGTDEDARVVHVEIVIGLLAAVALLGALAQRVGLPYPSVLVVGGLLIGVIPGVPAIRLDPALVLLGFLPPLVYASAFRASAFDLRPSVPHILTLAVGLVVFTVGAVALVGHYVAGLPWVPAFVLGALVAPTDPVSASAVVRRVGAPERIVAILEGEALINDGTGLAAFQVAVAASAAAFSIGHGIVRFAVISLGGAGIGLLVAWVVVHLRRRVDDLQVEIVLGLVAAFGSYAAAQAAGFSGVLAAVASGLYVGYRAEDISSPEVRLRSEPFWEALTYLLESILFLLIGLQFLLIARGLPGPSAWTPIGEAAAVLATAVVLRFAWMFTLGRALSLLGRVLPAHVEPVAPAELTVLGFCGMRGALSLAGALSIPLVAAGHPFPGRNEVIFLVYAVVLGTLVLPSLTLERLVRRLGLAQSERLREQLDDARRHVARAALTRLDEVAADPAADPDDGLGPLRAVYELRLGRLEHRSEPGAAARGEHLADVRRELVAAERRALDELRAERRLASEVLGRVAREIDLEEARLPPDAASPPPPGGRRSRRRRDLD